MVGRPACLNRRGTDDADDLFAANDGAPVSNLGDAALWNVVVIPVEPTTFDAKIGCLPSNASCRSNTVCRLGVWRYHRNSACG